MEIDSRAALLLTKSADRGEQLALSEDSILRIWEGIFVARVTVSGCNVKDSHDYATQAIRSLRALERGA